MAICGHAVAELDAAGATVSRFVYGTSGHVPDYMTKGTSAYRLLKDHLGSVRLTVNVATGAIAQQIDYDPWGKVLSDSQPGFQPFGFAGGLYDHETGLVRFGARDYDPEIGRWTLKDPGGFSGGENLYAYAYNDPVSYVDWTGRVPVAPHPVAIVAGAIIGGAFGAGSNALIQSLTKGCIDGWEVFIAGVTGALVGAAIPAIPWILPEHPGWWSMTAGLFNGLGNAGQYAATNLRYGKDVSGYAAGGIAMIGFATGTFGASAAGWDVKGYYYAGNSWPTIQHQLQAIINARGLVANGTVAGAGNLPNGQ